MEVVIISFSAANQLAGLGIGFAILAISCFTA
jgi:hypothetical protein